MARLNPYNSFSQWQWEDPIPALVSGWTSRANPGASGPAQYTTNADGSISGAGVTGIAFTGAGVSGGPPVGGVLTVNIPGMGALQEVTGNASAPDYSLTSSMATVQPSGCSPIALALSPGRYLVMVTVAASGCTAADTVQVQVLNTGTGAVIASSQQSAQVSGAGEVEIEATFYLNVAGRSQYVVQAMNAAAARGVVKMARTKVDALQLAGTSTSTPQVGISSFAPIFGLSGTLVTITGFGFTYVAGVYFGGAPASSFTINSDTQITATVAATVTGSVTVALANGAAISLSSYYYQSTAPYPTTGLILHLDAATGVTTSGGLVTAWTDLSASNNNFSGGVSPSYVANVQNGLPGVQFNGTTQYLQSANNNMLSPFTIIVLHKTAASFGSTYSFLLASLSNGGVEYGLQQAAHQIIKDNTSVIESFTQSLSPSTLYISDVTYDGTNFALFLNKASQIASTGSFTFTPSKFVLGFNAAFGSQFMNGTLLEMFIYSSVLGTSDRQSVENYLDARWAAGI